MFPLSPSYPRYPILQLMEEEIVTHLAGEKANETYIGKYGIPAKVSILLWI
ncbi:ThiJ/PfpI family protein [Desulfosporosinus sp. BG]|nr:ThiJ/PfpI family protein [Desulfosporosinus sp. BG]